MVVVVGNVVCIGGPIDDVLDVVASTKLDIAAVKYKINKYMAI